MNRDANQMREDENIESKTINEALEITREKIP